MNLKTTALAVMLAAASISHAAPTLQTCAPMSISHNGDAGLSYLLACDAGGWSLKYSGSVPAGTESVVARYKLQASKASGESFSHNRTVRLPAPNLLGQALVREAVSLDNGDLALRECQEFNCTLYRPLGGVEKMAKATVTMPPELKRVSDEAARLNTEIAKSRVDASEQATVVAGLRQEIQALTQKLAQAQELVSAASADKTAAIAAFTALTEKLEVATSDLEAARKELSECAAEHKALKREHAAHEARIASPEANTDLTEKTAKVTALEQAHARLNVDLLNEQESKKSAQVALAASQAQVQELAAALQTAQRTIDDMVTEQANQVDELQAAYVDVKRQLTAAQQAEKVTQAVKVELTDAAQRDEKQAAQLKQLSEALASANSNAAAQEEAFITLKKAYEQNLKQLAELHVGQSAPPPADASITAERDAARAEVERLKAELDALEPQIAMLDTARIDALKSAQQMAKNTLQALDQIQELQEAKEDADKTIASSTAKLMEAAAKVEASNMARDLAMQAVAAAHADSDAQNLKNQELQAQLTKALENSATQQRSLKEWEALAEDQAKELTRLRQKLAENNPKVEAPLAEGVSD